MGVRLRSLELYQTSLVAETNRPSALYETAYAAVELVRKAGWRLTNHLNFRSTFAVQRVLGLLLQRLTLSCAAPTAVRHFNSCLPRAGTCYGFSKTAAELVRKPGWRPRKHLKFRGTSAVQRVFGLLLVRQLRGECDRRGNHADGRGTLVDDRIVMR